MCELIVMVKTSAERSRQYRERKARLNGKLKGPPKTNTQRVREHRERQKALRAAAVTDLATEEPLTDRDTVGHPEHHLSTSTIQNLPYTDFNSHKIPHKQFQKQFVNNTYGSLCSICDRLYFKNDLISISNEQEEVIRYSCPEIKVGPIYSCKTCKLSLNRNSVPKLYKFNGFKYPDKPAHLPRLDILSERLIAPRLPFMQIRRLRNVHDQFGSFGQIINVPVSENNMVRSLPRNIDGDHCINVHIKRKNFQKSPRPDSYLAPSDSYLMGLVNKANIKIWLDYLITTPLYRLYDINIDHTFLNSSSANVIPKNEISEDIPINESLTAQQHSLLWNDKKYLQIALGKQNFPQSFIFDKHAEELSFPNIYLGEIRKFNKCLQVTPFMMVNSELRRSDRRGVTPCHLLYMAMKIMRLRVQDGLKITFRQVAKNTHVTREEMESEEYINSALESNLAFLKTIPNSVWYWTERKKDVFAMLRQLGKPTIFLTLRANEIGWTSLLQTLYRLQNDGAEISKEDTEQLHYHDKCTLINEDAVTCAIYFTKLVNVLLSLLKYQKGSPFGNYRVLEYCKRIEFQHGGSPQAHILLWLDKAPKDPLRANKEDTIRMIDKLMSVSLKDASGNIRLQRHKHTSACYKQIMTDRRLKCRYEAPYLPSRTTLILTPMPKTELGFDRYAERYTNMRLDLAENDYPDIDAFFKEHKIISDQHYIDVLRAGITRPSVFLKRMPSEKWHIPFNPFILNVLMGTTNIQFITDEYSCAAYVAEYINKTNRGVSDLQRQIVTIMKEHPELDKVEVTKRLSVDMLNAVEISSQEAAWYLLREPMSNSSTAIVYIPTVWPIERVRIRRKMKELNQMDDDDDSTDIWKDNYFDKYEKRQDNLEDVTLAQFVAHYTLSLQNVYIRSSNCRIIRYRNYEMADNQNEYKREMVTLHFPFRNEELDVLVDMKFIGIYDDNEEVILQRRKEFESDFDIRKTIDICRELCSEGEVDDDGGVMQDLGNSEPETDFEPLYRHKNSDLDDDVDNNHDESECVEMDEIKTEVLDDIMIKTEPPDEISPEFVEVHEELLTSFKHEDSDFE